MITNIVVAVVAFGLGYFCHKSKCNKGCKKNNPNDLKQKASLPPNKDRDTPIGT